MSSKPQISEIEEFTFLAIIKSSTRFSCRTFICYQSIHQHTEIIKKIIWLVVGKLEKNNDKLLEYDNYTNSPLILQSE